jgi:hypothetical protein
MEYNTTRKQMVIPEYGRNIQEMIEYTCAIEDREKRNKSAKFIINVMSQMHPQVRDSVDYKHKLWDHLHIISDFKLDVDAPFPPPSPLTLSTKPEHLSYHDKEIAYRHYGKNIALIIEKAIEYEEGPEKDALVKIIAIHLKKSYLNWNRDSVSDELIEEHLRVLSQGKLKLKEDVRLTTTSDLLARNKPRKPFRPKPSGNNNAQRGRKKI